MLKIGAPGICRTVEEKSASSQPFIKNLKECRTILSGCGKYVSESIPFDTVKWMKEFLESAAPTPCFAPLHQCENLSFNSTERKARYDVFLQKEPDDYDWQGN